MVSLSDTNIKFCVDVYNQLKVQHANENILYSPIAMISALAMLYMGAGGNTQLQMKKVLHFNSFPGAENTIDSQCGSSEHIHDSLKDLLSGITKSNATYTLEMADKLYVDKMFTVLPEYLNCVKKFYPEGLEEVNFKTAAEEARQLINSWVEKQTRGQIKDFLISSSVDLGTVLVFLNTIYFRGIWKTEFNAGDTREMPFRVTKQQSKPVQMMCQTGTFFVGMLPEDKLKILELPYASGELSMLVLLPDEDSGLEEIENAINFEKLTKWTSTNAMQKKNVKVYLPRMKMEEKYNLIPVLTALGMTDLFSPSPDLSGISSVQGLKISQAVHGAYIEVNEEGTEAGGSAVVIGEIKFSHEIEELKCDHPFLYLIRHNPTNAILFFGRFVSP